MVASFLEFTSINYCKPLSGLVESYNEVIEHGRGFNVPVAFQSEREAASVMEDIYMEFELLRSQVGFDSIGQARGRLVAASFSLCDQ